MMHAHVDCQRQTDVTDIGAAPVLRIALADTTELDQAMTDLRISATVFEAQEGILITDANGLILKVNQAFTKITG